MCRTWCYESGSSYSRKIHDDIGFLINPTDEQILDAGKKLVLGTKEISDHRLKYIPTDYLTNVLIIRLKYITQSDNNDKIKKLKQKSKDANEAYDNFVKLLESDKS